MLPLAIVFGKGRDECEAHALTHHILKILAYHAKIALLITKQNPSLKNRQNKQLSIHETTEQGCPLQYSDVTNLA